MANWTRQIAKERARQISLGYTDEHNDAKTADEWDIVFQCWWTFMLQAALAGNIELFRERFKQVATLGYALGQAQMRALNDPPETTG